MVPVACQHIKYRKIFAGVNPHLQKRCFYKTGLCIKWIQVDYTQYMVIACLFMISQQRLILYFAKTDIISALQRRVCLARGVYLGYNVGQLISFFPIPMAYL